VKALAVALLDADKAPDVQTQLARNGAERFIMTGGEFDTFIHGDVAK
jgi:hypothetical protein